MGLFGGNKNQIRIIAKSGSMQYFLHELQELVNKHDARIFAHAEQQERIAQHRASVGATHEGGFSVTNAEARSFQAGAAREMENFLEQAAELVKKHREENHRML